MRTSELPARIRELRRKWRRFEDQARKRSSINLNQLERTILDHLYESKAIELGLSVRRAGPVLIVEGRGRRFNTYGVWTDFDTMPLGLLSGDKVVVRDLLMERGLNVPDGGCFHEDQAEAAWKLASSLGGPVVTKPARGTSSGRGVRVGLIDRNTFRRAFAYAAIYSPDVLVEKFVPGENYRVLVYRGRTISVLLRDLPAVVGDGRKDVRALLAEENAKRIRSSRWQEGDPVLLPIEAGTAAEKCLAKQGLAFTSVPEEGRKVRLGETCNYAAGASYEEVRSRTHPRIREASEAAAEALGLTLAGVDVIAPDIASPDYFINEVNTTPGLESHYFVRNREEAADPIGQIFADLFGERP